MAQKEGDKDRFIGDGVNRTDTPTTVIHLKHLRAYVCEFCLSGWDKKEDGFANGTCACCGGWANELDMKVDKIEVDLNQTILLLAPENAPDSARSLLDVIRKQRMRTVTLDDIVPHDEKVIEREQTLEDAIKAARIEVLVFTKGWRDDARFNQAVEAAYDKKDIYVIPVFADFDAFSEAPFKAKRGEGLMLSPDDVHRNPMFRPVEVILGNLTRTYRDAELFYADKPSHL